MQAFWFSTGSADALITALEMLWLIRPLPVVC
jgi:hypothetical protein